MFKLSHQSYQYLSSCPPPPFLYNILACNLALNFESVNGHKKQFFIIFNITHYPWHLETLCGRNDLTFEKWLRFGLVSSLASPRPLGEDPLPNSRRRAHSTRWNSILHSSPFSLAFLSAFQFGNSYNIELSQASVLTRIPSTEEFFQKKFSYSCHPNAFRI